MTSTLASRPNRQHFEEVTVDSDTVNFGGGAFPGCQESKEYCICGVN